MRKTPDSTHPEFWSSRYRSGKTPWDFQGVPAALSKFLARTGPGAGRTVLIPGCGSGYEIAAFDAAGFNVTAIDFSPAAIARARRLLGRPSRKILRAEFFAYTFGRRRFDLIYERTFLCALPPKRWSEYAKRMAALLAPGARLVGTFFFGKAAGGPPFPIARRRLNELLRGAFRRTRTDEVGDSLPVFRKREQWQEWRRLGSE